MKNFEHPIDERVKESVESFKPVPPSDVWQRLDNSLEAANNPRPIFHRRWLTGVAAVLLAFIAGYFVAIITVSQRGVHEQTTSLAQIDTEKLESAEDHETDKGELISIKEDIDKPITDVTYSDLSTTEPKPLTEYHEYYDLVTVDQTYLPEIYNYEELYTIDPLTVFQIPSSEIWDICDDIFIASTEHKHGKFQRWRIGGVAGQTYSHYHHGHEPSFFSIFDPPQASNRNINNPLSYTKEQFTRPDASLGLSLEYKISPRTSIVSGVTYHRFSAALLDNFTDIPVYASAKPLYTTFGPASISEDHTYANAKNSLPEISDGRIDQHFLYLEIPFTGSYKVIDRRAGLAVRAGFGGNILTGNKIIHVEKRRNEVIGSTQGLANFYISTVMALDFHYNINDNWQICFEPVYRHALQSVSEESMWDPRLFSFGLYSGLKYRF